jgi:hypothetical protein
MDVQAYPRSEPPVYATAPTRVSGVKCCRIGKDPDDTLDDGALGAPRRNPMLLQIGSAMLAADNGSLHTILWIIAAVLVIAGIVTIFRGAVLWGIVLIVVGLLVGPGGVSIFN